eukprot:8767217-Ditylum_brightwellii.AAC.1
MDWHVWVLHHAPPTVQAEDWPVEESTGQAAKARRVIQGRGSQADKEAMGSGVPATAGAAEEQCGKSAHVGPTRLKQ